MTPAGCHLMQAIVPFTFDKLHVLIDSRHTEKDRDFISLFIVTGFRNSATKDHLGVSGRRR